MNWNFIITGGIFLVLAAFVGADYVSTSISTDGTMMVASSGNNDNGSFASRVMAVDTSQLSRSITGDEDFQTDLVIHGSGPILASDYASARTPAKVLDEVACTFLTDSRVQAAQVSDLYSMGMLQNGSYEISRVVGSGLTGGTVVNGSGMVGFGSETVGNNSQKTRGFVAGNLSVRDFVRYGGRL